MYGCFWLIPRLQRFNPSNSIAKADRGESSDSTITIFGQESLRMMRKGASYSPGDRFGTLKSGLQCRVSLLDGSDCIVDIDVSAYIVHIYNTFAGKVPSCTKPRVQSSQLSNKPSELQALVRLILRHSH